MERIDLRWMGLPGLVASYLVRAPSGEAALVEAGPGSTVETLSSALRAAGVEPGDVAAVLVTHVHLDHAGAAGALLERLPRARVHVHPAGARHLADPSRLLASAGRVYGGRMDEMWGEMRPVPPGRIVATADGGEVRVGGLRLTALDTPGHAAHHLAFQLEDAGVVFTGDVAGIRLQGSRYVRPPTPPPEFQPADWRRSVARLGALGARRLLLTHFGGAGDVQAHLAGLDARLADWTTWSREWWRANGDDEEALAAALRERGDAEIRAAGGDGGAAARYEAAVPYRMMASGIARWLRRGAA